MKDMKIIEVYSDGSGNTFDSDGGWGYRIIHDGQVHSEGSGYLKSSTNNVAELTGAINGLEQLQHLFRSGTIQRENARVLSDGATEIEKTKVVLVSDSQLVLGYASGKYQCKALHLAPLYIKLRKLYQELDCDARWVKGHSGDEHNEACDKLAKNARNNGKI